MTLAEALQCLRSAETSCRRRQASCAAFDACGASQRWPGTRSMKRLKRAKHQRGKSGGDKKPRTNCANCHADGHWYAECTARTDKPLRTNLAKKLAEKQGNRPLTPLVGSVRQAQGTRDAGAQQGLLIGLLLCAPSSLSTLVDLTGGETSASTSSPVYSLTSPASSSSDDNVSATCGDSTCFNLLASDDAATIPATSSACELLLLRQQQNRHS